MSTNGDFIAFFSIYIQFAAIQNPDSEHIEL